MGTLKFKYSNNKLCYAKTDLIFHLPRILVNKVFTKLMTILINSTHKIFNHELDFIFAQHCKSFYILYSLTR